MNLRIEFKNRKGFTLTEVMIGMMILTVAIVAASNLLISLTNANKYNVTNLQAYYLAQEGIEAVRNIRDSNWLHNRDWMGSDSSSIWVGDLEGDFVIDLNSQGWQSSVGSSGAASGINDLQDLSAYVPWIINSGDGVLKKHNFSAAGNTFLSSFEDLNADPTEFARKINVEPYADGGTCATDNQCVLVSSFVTWRVNSKDKEMLLQAVLTDWKGGSL